MIKENEYQCAMCKNVYEKGQSDEEAMSEAEENFPGVPGEEMEIICDDCYKQMFN